MRLLFIVLLTAVVILMTTEATLASVSSKAATLLSPTVPRSLTDREIDVTSQRFRRADKVADEKEDRGITASGVEHLVASATKKAQLQLWLTQRKSAETTFKLLNLERKSKFIFGSKEFLTWAEYVTKLKKKGAEGAMINILLKHYDDGALARLIAGAKSSTAPSMQNLATKLQEAQFTKWMIASRRPIAVEKKLNGLGQGMFSKKDQEIVDAYKHFIGTI